MRNRIRQGQTGARFLFRLPGQPRAWANLTVSGQGQGLVQGELRDRYGHPHRILVKDGNQFWLALDGYYGKNSTEEDFGGGKEHEVLSLIFLY